MGTGKIGSVPGWYHPRDTTAGGEILLEILRLCKTLVMAASPHVDRARIELIRRDEAGFSRRSCVLTVPSSWLVAVRAGDGYLLPPAGGESFILPRAKCQPRRETALWHPVIVSLIKRRKFPVFVIELQ